MKHEITKFCYKFYATLELLKHCILFWEKVQISYSIDFPNCENIVLAEECTKGTSTV